ncbi:alpha/beta hydrolase [Bradyrhizobium sp.]|uniref:alpha/beta hydrolase n=1 Tax=Bradyrhizobium sp. TaxID=376 RepID=UPI002630CDF5|nr:alpha/beta hydrolase [Bradyrhizobium sp.]
MSLRAELLRLALRLFKPSGKHRELDLETARRRLRRLEPLVPGPSRGTRTETLDAGGVNAVRIIAPQAREDACVLHFHGGGYVIGTAPLYRDFTWRLGAVARASVLYFDYRLAPEHPFPAALDDAVTVYRWLAKRIDPKRIAVVGDSAGGGLALATLYRMRDEGLPLPAAAVAISPWTDLALTGPSLQSNAAADPMMDAARLPALVDCYLAGADARHPYASPLYGDAAGLPPTLIQVGGDEILRDDSLRMAERLKATGCDAEIEVWPRMPHAWHLYARILPEGREAIARAGQFVQNWLAR